MPKLVTAIVLSACLHTAGLTAAEAPRAAQVAARLATLASTLRKTGALRYSTGGGTALTQLERSARDVIARPGTGTRALLAASRAVELALTLAPNRMRIGRYRRELSGLRDLVLDGTPAAGSVPIRRGARDLIAAVGLVAGEYARAPESLRLTDGQRFRLALLQRTAGEAHLPWSSARTTAGRRLVLEDLRDQCRQASELLRSLERPGETPSAPHQAVRTLLRTVDADLTEALG